MLVNIAKNNYNNWHVWHSDIGYWQHATSRHLFTWLYECFEVTRWISRCQTYHFHSYYKR